MDTRIVMQQCPEGQQFDQDRWQETIASIELAYLASFTDAIRQLRRERADEAQTPDEALVQLDVDEFVTEAEYRSMCWRGRFK